MVERVENGFKTTFLLLRLICRRCLFFLLEKGATIYLNSGYNVDAKKIRKMLLFTYIGVGDIPVEGFFTTNLICYIFGLKDLRSNFKTNTDSLNRH